MSIRPVFIGGCDRSGTTLFGAMLGSHSECLCVPESPFMIEVWGGSDIDPARINSQLILNKMDKHPFFKVWGVDLDLQNSSSSDYSVESYPELIKRLVYEYGHMNGKSSPQIWIDHTPSNVKHAATLFSLFPDAKMIHLVRDGRAVAASIMPLTWGPNTIDKAAYFWLRNLAFGFAAETTYGPERVIRVRYEDLVSNPATTLETACNFINIDYQPQMIKGDGFKVPSFTRKQHALVGKKPEISRIKAWENTLSSRQVEIFENLTGDMLSCLGYVPYFGKKARNLTNMERFNSTLKTIQMFMSNLYNQAKIHWTVKNSSRLTQLYK